MTIFLRLIHFRRDQFCSLVFTLSNLYLIGCAYTGGFDERWSKCLATKQWGVPFVLASLPFLSRFVQSIRRWADSKLVTHLINVHIIVIARFRPMLRVLFRLANTEPASYTTLYTLIGDIMVSLECTLTLSARPHDPSGGARGYSFVLWCIFGTIYALYASAWVRTVNRVSRHDRAECLFTRIC